MEQERNNQGVIKAEVRHQTQQTIPKESCQLQTLQTDTNRILQWKTWQTVSKNPYNPILSIGSTYYINYDYKDINQAIEV